MKLLNLQKNLHILKRILLLRMYMPKRTSSITFSESINLALKTSMKKDKNIICYGLGINDPKAIFNTTKNLYLGSDRVLMFQHLRML